MKKNSFDEEANDDLRYSHHHHEHLFFHFNALIFTRMHCIASMLLFNDFYFFRDFGISFFSASSCNFLSIFKWHTFFQFYRWSVADIFFILTPYNVGIYLWNAETLRVFDYFIIKISIIIIINKKKKKSIIDIQLMTRLHIIIVLEESYFQK